MKEHHWRQIPPTADIDQSLPVGVRSAARPLRVLEFFDEIRRPARAREIWERLGFPQSTTSLLLNGMVTLGYLDYDPASRSFLPSLRVAMLGRWRDRGRGYTAALESVVDQLFEYTGLSASLTTRHGIFLRYLHLVQSERAGQPHAALNTRRYAVWSTAGMVLLASTSHREVQTLIRRTLAEKGPSVGKIRGDRIPEMLDLARKQGYFAATGLVTPNVRTISMLVPAEVTKTDPALAITLASGRSTFDQADEKLARVMRTHLSKLLS